MQCLLFLLLCCPLFLWADTITLENDSNVQLSAIIQDANGKMLEEMVIEAGDSMTWSLDYEYYGVDAEPTNPAIPYTVNWYCMSGDLFSSCTDVASDSTVGALSCEGSQQCRGSTEED